MSQKTRLWALVTGLLGVLVILYGVFAGLVPQLQNATQIRTETDGVELIIQTQEAQLAQLQQADQDAEDLKDELRELEAAIPLNPNWPEFLQEMQQLQSATGAIVSEITAQPAILPGAATETVADPTAAEVADGETTDPAANPTETTPAATATLVHIPISLTVTGTPDQVAAFIKAVQTGERLFKVNDVSIDSTGEVTNGTANGAIYVVP